jgi:hypothetical protein
VLVCLVLVTADTKNFCRLMVKVDRLCGLVVRVLDYRHRGPGFDSRALQKKISGSGTGCTQLREYKLRSYLIEK